MSGPPKRFNEMHDSPPPSKVEPREQLAATMARDPALHVCLYCRSFLTSISVHWRGCSACRAPAVYASATQVAEAVSSPHSTLLSLPPALRPDRSRGHQYSTGKRPASGRRHRKSKQRKRQRGSGLCACGDEASQNAAGTKEFVVPG